MTNVNLTHLKIFISMIKEAGIYNNISQAYAALDTNKAVGVMVSSVAVHPPADKLNGC